MMNSSQAPSGPWAIRIAQRSKSWKRSSDFSTGVWLVTAALAFRGNRILSEHQRRTAIHEAGHAVVAVVLGLPIGSATNDRPWGHAVILPVHQEDLKPAYSKWSSLAKGVAATSMASEAERWMDNYLYLITPDADSPQTVDERLSRLRQQAVDPRSTAIQTSPALFATGLFFLTKLVRHLPLILTSVNNCGGGYLAV